MTNPYGPWATAIDAGRNPHPYTELPGKCAMETTTKSAKDTKNRGVR